MMKTCFAAVFVSIGFAACAARPYPAYSIDPSTDAEQITNVVVTEASLRDVVRVGVPLVERTAGGELRVRLPVRNIDSEEIQVMVQISYLDGQGRPVGDDSNWQVEPIGSGRTVPLEWVSRTADASDYLVRLAWHK